MLKAKDFRAAAWQKLTGFWTTAVLCTLLYLVINYALGATLIGALLLGGPFWAGYHWFCLAQIRGQHPSVSSLFDGFQKSFVTNIAAYLLVSIFTALWSLLLVIPGIVKSYSYAMVPFILNDNPDMEVTKAIDESRYLMDGNKWRLFCLDFSFIGWYLLTSVTFGVAGLWVSPYSVCARAQFYETIKNKD